MGMREKVEEAITLIADRHNLCVDFDFNIDADVLCFRFYVDEFEILKGSLRLSIIATYRVFESIEKEVVDRIETLKSKLIDNNGIKEASECHKRDICKNYGLKCKNCKQIAMDYFDPK